MEPIKTEESDRDRDSRQVAAIIKEFEPLAVMDRMNELDLINARDESEVELAACKAIVAQERTLEQLQELADAYGTKRERLRRSAPTAACKSALLNYCDCLTLVEQKIRKIIVADGVM